GDSVEQVDGAVDCGEKPKSRGALRHHCGREELPGGRKLADAGRKRSGEEVAIRCEEGAHRGFGVERPWVVARATVEGDCGRTRAFTDDAREEDVEALVGIEPEAAAQVPWPRVGVLNRKNLIA